MHDRVICRITLSAFPLLIFFIFAMVFLLVKHSVKHSGVIQKGCPLWQDYRTVFGYHLQACRLDGISCYTISFKKYHMIYFLAIILAIKKISKSVILKFHLILFFYDIIVLLLFPKPTTERGWIHGSINIFLNCCYGRSSWSLYLQMVRQQKQ